MRTYLLQRFKNQKEEIIGFLLPNIICTKFQGQTVTPYRLKAKDYPLIYAGDAAIAGTPANLTG